MSDFLAAAGLLVAAGACAASILLPPGRSRSLAMLVAVALFPTLIVGDQWHTEQIVDLRHDEARIAALATIGIVVVAALAYLFRRWPPLLPLAIVVALPFRIPLHAGGDTANLLVPLYLVIAAAVVATLLRDWSAPRIVHAARPLAWLLAAAVVLYALQTLYSEDFSKGLQNVCFFFVPFTVAYRLLREVEWDRRLLTLLLCVVGAEAALFVAIGSVEYLTRSLFWNDQVIRSNEFHTYFRVNSVFWDPNVYGRYLALVITIATAALLWAREQRTFALLTILVAFLWLGLAQTFSQSSYVALLAGLAVLAAIRWSWRWTVLAIVVGAVVGMAATGIDLSRINIETSGRANLVEGGADLFVERPGWGYGSGSFQAAYRDHQENKDLPVAVSHTEPVTVAAEQGILGLAVYLALIVVALWTLSAGLFGGSAAGGAVAGDAAATGPAARSAVLAAFVALLVHTIAYAGFFNDPITWVLLAIGASLAHPDPVRDSA